MAVLWIVIITLAIYNTIGLIIVLCTKDEDIPAYWAIGVYVPPLLVIAVILKVSKMIHNKIHNKWFAYCIVQARSENGAAGVKKICKLQDYNYFYNSMNWRIVNRYPSRKELRAHKLPLVTDKDLQEIKTERICFNCVHNGVDCNEDVWLCTNQSLMDDSFSDFELNTSDKRA